MGAELCLAHDMGGWRHWGPLSVDMRPTAVSLNLKLGPTCWKLLEVVVIRQQIPEHVCLPSLPLLPGNVAMSSEVCWLWSPLTSVEN